MDKKRCYEFAKSVFQIKIVFVLFLLLCSVAICVPIKLYTIPGNSTVYINGNLFGMSDNMGVFSELLFINEGVHTFQIQKPGFNSVSYAINIREATSITLTLIPSGILRVNAEPSDSVIKINREVVGRGQFVGEFPVGRQFVQVEAKGYISKTYYVDVKQYFTRELNVVLEKEGRTFIVSEPSQSQVTVNGEFVGLSPLELYLSPGTHIVTFSKDWHFPQTQMIEVIGEVENKVFQKLEAFSNLIITADPVDAGVVFDGRKVGKAPLKLQQLKPGKYQIEFSAYEYVTQVDELFISPGENSVHKGLRLKEYNLEVNSTPTTIVMIDNIQKGMTPLNFKSTHGIHTVYLKSGELEWMTEIDLFEDKTLFVDLNYETTVLMNVIPGGEAYVLNDGKKWLLPAIINTYAGLQTFEVLRAGYPVRRRVYKLSPGKIYEYTINLEGEASLFVTTNPPGAKVFWMDSYLGDTPLRDVRTRPGSGIMKYQWFDTVLEERMTLFDGQTYTISKDIPATTKVLIDSFPSGLVVKLNGREIGKTPVSIELKAGTHSIECVSSGGESRIQLITLTGEVTRKINFVF